MALSLSDKATLARDRGAFFSRVWASCQQLSGYILGENGDVPNHIPRAMWAVRAYANPDGAAAQIQPVVVNDPAITEAGTPDASDVSDAALYAAVEAAVNKVLPSGQ